MNLKQNVFFFKKIKGLFGTRCIDANTSSLKNLGCSDKFSKYACTNVSNTLCYWNDEKCSKYDQ